MPRGDIVVGLDVGTTKVASIVAEITPEKEVNIIGVGSNPAVGLRKGVVVDLGDTVRSIERAVEKAERMAGVDIEGVYVGVAGEHISSLNNRGVVAVSGSRGEVTEEDVERVLEAVKIISLPADREIIHVIPRGYIIDGQDGIKNPVGMSGQRLEVEAHIVTGAVTFIQNLLKCVQRVGLMVNDLVLQPVASASAILYPDEKEIGVVLVDIGGGTTDIAIFVGGSIAYTVVIPVGGNHFDRDIAYGLSTTLSEAERIKKEYGYALRSLIPNDELIEVRNIGDEKTRELPQRLVGEIVEARMQEIFDLVKREIAKSGYQDLIPAGMVVTGGTALLKGIVEAAKGSLDLPVRVGVPQRVGGLTEEVSSPIYATGVGLVLYGKQNYERLQPIKAKGGRLLGEVMGRIKRWFKEFI
ncbi:MAG: cell division protein FtsA [Armatimonadetes bacterium CG07_land_8_20_14_0_80_40_9]|nr:MAG: cell division protein FtsA [Armatimonadetes bacterium CG07_land_8_20_14_0_80_40_9]